VIPLDILDDLLKNQIMDAMRKEGLLYSLSCGLLSPDICILVEEEITNQIDEIVKEKVAECLKDHIPPELQEEFASSKRELQELTLRLHNS
jgi:hypothetical protein